MEPTEQKFTMPKKAYSARHRQTQAMQLLNAGFDYVTEKSGIMLFWEPKKFGSGRS